MKILFIGGSLNQTSMLHKISQQLPEHEIFFAPYYADGIIHLLAKLGLLNRTILGGRHRQDTIRYLKENHLKVDFRGRQNDYDLVVTGSDAIIPRNIRNKRLVLVQEGMTVPEGLRFQLVRLFKFPRWMADTASTGLSNAFDAFCVASVGYKELFIRKGVVREKIVVTGIPNFDDFAAINKEAFPYNDFVLVATSPYRETLRLKNRRAFIRRCVEIADGRQLIFKLHPLEDAQRAIKEINRHAPGALVFWRGNVDEMIVQASIVITQQSSCTYTALALGKKVYSDLDVNELKRLLPIQNKGTSASKIAKVCRQLLNTPMPVIEQRRRKFQPKSFWEKIEI